MMLTFNFDKCSISCFLLSLSTRRCARSSRQTEAQTLLNNSVELIYYYAHKHTVGQNVSMVEVVDGAGHECDRIDRREPLGGREGRRSIDRFNLALSHDVLSN